MTKENLANDILVNIAEREKFAKKDSVISETLLLISILSSFMTATLAVNNSIDKNIIATLGGLPGIMILIAKKFLFAKKSIWNELYRMDLQRLLNELEGTEPSILSEKYTALQEKKDREWAAKEFEF